MTRKLSISLPDDIAARLDEVDNASAYVADAIRVKSRRDAILGMLNDAGYEFTEERADTVRAQWADLLKHGPNPDAVARSKAKWRVVASGDA